MSKIDKLINLLESTRKINKKQVRDVFSDIMSGRVETGDLKKFLLALKNRETPEVIAGAASAMRQVMTKINVRSYSNEVVLDTCGTGGTNFHTFNISTATAFVIAGCSVKVAKHGNRAVSSRFGSADVLQELGLNLEIPPEGVCEIIKEIGIGFLFAPLYHPGNEICSRSSKPACSTHHI